jgi:energy-coupling factor transporter ATP-binding protein EcfA2
MNDVAALYEIRALTRVYRMGDVEVPLRLQGLPTDERTARVGHLLSLVGLGHRADHRPAELSGGEQQRVAIARALANTPDLLIADEPTGQLDSGTGQRIMDLLRSLVDEGGLAMLVATHDATLLADADVAWELRDGRLDTGVLAPRWSGDVDRSRTISASTTLPAPVVDEHAAFRPAEAGDDPAAGDAVQHPRPRPRRPAARPTDPRAPGDLPGEDGADTRPRLRWGPDGEPLEDGPDDDG